MLLIRLVRAEASEHLRPLAVMTVLTSIATTALLWVADAAARQAQTGQANPRLLLMFVVAAVLFGVTQNYVLITASSDVERLIHRLRLRLFDAVRRSDLPTLDGIGRGALHAALTQDTQTLARTLPMLVIGGQQAVMLVFLGLYLAWLSPIAFVCAFGFAGISIAVRFARMQALGRLMRDAMAREIAVFDGLRDLLGGFKEVRMSRARADGVIGDIAASSADSRRTKTGMKAQWGREFALLQSLFYALIGLMVFVVPLFATGYSEVVIPATMAALFIVGPVGTLAHVTPLVTETEFALANIAALEERLIRAADGAVDETAAVLPAPPRSISFHDAMFTYRGASGEAAFTVGPLTAEFHAGEITFITGGNGSGKSTMLRLLTGLMPLSQGALQADGRPVVAEQRQSYRDHITAIFSDFHLARRLYGVRDPQPHRVQGLLERYELAGKTRLADGAFSTVDLSTGQRKRLALVVAELADKPVIVLDEWAADQDPHFRREFYETILPDLKARDKIVICVTHDDRWFDMADRIYHLHEGRIEEV